MRAPHASQVWVQHLVYSPAPARCATKPGIHDHLTLAYFTDGKATFDQRGKQTISAGDVCLIPAGEPHRLRTTHASAAWGIGICSSCFATGSLRDLLEPFERVRAGASAVVRIPPERQSHLAALCAELERETRAVEGPHAHTWTQHSQHARVTPTGPRPHGTLVQNSLLALVLAEVARASSLSAPGAAAPDSLVGAALHFIERHCLGPLTLGEVATAVKRSPAHVTTAVKKATGKSVGEWVVSGRLAEARSRLLHSDERIDAIADRVGYADATHFIRMFRRAHGMTPAAWRRAARTA